MQTTDDVIGAAMHVSGICPSCQNVFRAEILSIGDAIKCDHCDWNRLMTTADITDSHPSRCLACYCTDLWRQKDFPQKLGVAVVAVGALLSTIAFYHYLPETAIGVLLVFALIDLLLYTFMPDVLVCYRCGTMHRRFDSNKEHPAFSLELAERYRQEADRLAKTSPDG